MKKLFFILAIILVSQLLSSYSTQSKVDSLQNYIDTIMETQKNKHFIKPFYQKDDFPKIREFCFQDLDGYLWLSNVPEEYDTDQIDKEFYRFNGIDFENMSQRYYKSINDTLKAVLEIFIV